MNVLRDRDEVLRGPSRRIVRSCVLSQDHMGLDATKLGAEGVVVALIFKAGLNSTATKVPAEFEDNINIQTPWIPGCW